MSTILPILPEVLLLSLGILLLLIEPFLKLGDFPATDAAAAQNLAIPMGAIAVCAWGFGHHPAH